MRGVNIHVDFVMIQCTKNKNLTPLSHPLCHPAIRRGSNNVYSGPRVPPLTRLPCLGVGRMPEDGTLGYHIPPRHTARLKNSVRFAHIKHPDKLSFAGLLHLSTATFDGAL